MRPFAAVAVVVLVSSLAACASGRPEGGVTGAQQFEKMKTLEGTWETVPGSPMPGKVVYHVVGGGSALEETLFPGQPHEMVTMYHMDGDQFVMTHYCAAGNQPSMRAAPAADVNTIKFEFVSLSNGDPAKGTHMHEGTFTCGPHGNLTSHWVGWQDGKPGGPEVEMQLVRSQQ
jgi:hypothetical protein